MDANSPAPESVTPAPVKSSQTRKSCPTRPLYQLRNGAQRAAAAPTTAKMIPMVLRILRTVPLPPGKSE